MTSAAPAAPAPSAPLGQGWIVSPRYDTVFFTASVAVPLLLWAAFEVGFMTGVAVYVTFQLVFNMPHNFQTWTLTVLDPEDRRQNGVRYLVAFAACCLVLGVPMVLSPDGVYPWVRTALIYWGYYHLVRQHYGFQRLYERKMGGVGPRESFWYGRFLDAVSYGPLLIRFGFPERMTIKVGGAASWVWHPVFPAPVVTALAVAWVGVVAAAVAHHLWMWRQGRRLLGPRAMLFASVALAFGLAGAVIEDFIVAVAVVTAFHNLQYLGLLWFHNRNRVAQGDAGANPVMGWLAHGKVPLYVAVSLLYGVVVFAPRALFRDVRVAELPLAAVVALHYYVDARVWRFKDYPKRGAWLRLRG